jgi:two-component system, OmpR family, sensor kinase
MTPSRRGMRVLAVIAPLALAALLAATVVAAGGNGTFRFGLPLATLLVGLGLAVSAVVGVLLLVVPRRRARRLDELERMRQQGAAAERDAHRRFLGRLDHELKNPVTAIRSALAAGEQTPPANLEIASTQAARLSGVVTQLRALSELETRRIEIERVDLTALVAEEVAALEGELAARGTARRISTTFPTVPWPLPPVAGDPDLLAVVVRNLLLNAVKYSDPGARIEVRGTEDGDAVAIEVADTGWGIAPEDLPFVFDELWRAGAARAVEGSGMGLSLVRVVVRRHGGEVTARSLAGQGTSIRLVLPRASR